ncbi:MAG: type II toxin-antitoxin system VapC family toxin [Anaerolineales bacterium]|jgi:predicted nucleic acid-binding protein
MTTPPSVVIDASPAVKAILPAAARGHGIIERIKDWHQAGMRLVAPEIWLPEVISVIRQAIYIHILTDEEGQVAIENVFRLGVDIIPSDLDLCRSAIAWACRLEQSKAYDGFYLALAERLRSEFWTGDERLLNRARQLGASWVKTDS